MKSKMNTTLNNKLRKKMETKKEEIKLLLLAY